jgi:ABC-type oligopeptide transport system substrate-binding subunit
MDFGTYAQNVGAPRKTAWVTWAHGYTPRPIAEPISGMETWLMSRARYNSAVESPTIDELANKIRANTDSTKRVDDYRAMAREFYDRSYAVPIASVPSLYAYNPKVLKDWPMQPGEAYLSGYDRAVAAR